jgi:futalosine hydrolase
MKILIVAATAFEIAPFERFYEENKARIKINIDFLVTGIGMVATTFSLTKHLQSNDYQLVINAGIAGSFDTNRNLGDVVHVVCEVFTDIGAEDKDGTFIDFFQNGLIDNNIFPFENGALLNKKAFDNHFLPLVKGITRNTTSGFLPNIEKIKNTFPADIETMEGAAFFYVCLQLEVNFIALRAISNYVAPRNREAWQMELAIKNLNDTLIDMAESLKAE